MDYTNILSCWHKLELFASTPVPKIKNCQEFTTKYWNEYRGVKSKDRNKVVVFTIYFGVIKQFEINDILRILVEDESSDINKDRSHKCFASIKLNGNGIYLPDTLSVSPLPWAITRLNNGELGSNDWAAKFKTLELDIFDALDEILNQIQVDSDDELLKTPRVLSVDDIENMQSIIIKTLGWSKKLKIYIFANEVPKDKDSDLDEPASVSADLMSSFYLKDLEELLSYGNLNGESTAYSHYLKGCMNQIPERQDVFEDTEVLRKSLTPINYPDGAWPSEYNLSLMQQFSVNTIFNNLSDENDRGVFSVNGPPGTGKTTLLRDIIAAIVVKRAKAMSLIKNPVKAFKMVGDYDSSKKNKAFVYSPHEELTHGGIVVASSNNGAVENISKELPLKSEVGKYTDQVSYFREVAENCVDEENWGLISAVLGNKKNRSAIVSNLWFNDEVDDLQQYLKENGNSEISLWNDIQNRFNDKLDEVHEEKRRLEKIREESEKVHELQRVVLDVLAQFKVSYEELSRVISELKAAEELLSMYENDEIELLKELDIIKRTKPGFFVYWFSCRIRKMYNKAYARVLERIQHNVELKAEKKGHVAALLRDVKTATIETEKLKKSLILKEQKFNYVVQKIAEAKEELGANYAGDEYWDEIDTKMVQESCPWYSKRLKQLNSELFILALELNEVFILTANYKFNSKYNSVSKQISSTLSSFFKHLQGGGAHFSEEQVKAMWDTFFLVIPVISTAFASAQTMFAGLNKEDIPWLFIDEAGQAVPQAAVGSIWRSKRVAVVGDPLQIEPVVTTPDPVMKNISTLYNLDDNNIDPSLSVQSMVDRVNVFGTYLGAEENRLWLGMPLRVHRRCLDPMFSIANSIAYDNSMVLSTFVPKAIDIAFQSSFIHCEGSVSGKHYVEEQAKIIESILLQEISKSKELPDIFVISPFSEISSKLKSVLYTPLISKLRSYYPQVRKEEMYKWLKSNIGTVHTFQGKQAKGVILCLGLDKNCEGAARWASSKPNLLNVALTRAKYRFVAVGDKDIWLKQPYFKQLTMLR